MSALTRSPAVPPGGRRTVLLAVAAAAIVLALPFLPLLQADFRVTQLQLAAALTIIVLGVNLVTGYSGQISLGHSGFALLGAYVLAVLMTKGVAGQPLHPAVATVAATAVSAAVGLAIGVPALRLSGPYLAIVTLGFGLVVPVVLRWDGLSALTGGGQGLLIPQPDAPAPLGALLTTGQWRYLLIAVPALGAVLTAWNLARSRFGRALIALRENELAAEQLGIDVARHKTVAFSLSGAYAGLGGALFAYAGLGVISPDSYGLADNISYLTAIVVGGIGTVSGAVLGAAFIACHTEIVDYVLGETWAVSLGSRELFAVPAPFAGLERPEALCPAVTAAILIAVIVAAPRGLVGVLGAAARLLRR